MARRRGWSARERTLAVAAAAVIGASVLVMKVMAPLWDRLGHLRQREAVSQEKFQRWRRLVDNREAIEQAYARYAAFRAQGAPGRIQAALLGELEELARSSNVQMALKPRPVQQDRLAYQFTLELQLDGTQQAVLEFLDRLFAWPHLLAFDRIRLSTSASSERPLRATIILSAYAIRTDQETSLDGEES